MSLVLTSNLSEQDTQNGLNLPYQYHNYLTQPLELEPDTEVAVQSIKVVKTGNVTLDNYNNLFYVCNAPENVNIRDTTGMPLPVYINELNNKSSVNPEELISLFETGMNRSVGNPMLVKSDLNQLGISVAVERSTTGDDKGAFQGFIFNISNPSLSGSLTEQKGVMSFENTLQLNTDYNGSWNSTNFRVTKYVIDDECDMIGTGMPLALSTGIFKSSFKEAGGNWNIGLTRYVDINNINIYEIAPPETNPLAITDSVFDWVAKSVYNNTTDKWELRIYHLLYDGIAGDYLDTFEFKYWEGGPASAGLSAPIEIFDTSASYGDKLVSEIEFKVINEQMNISVSSEDGTSVNLVLADGKQVKGEDNLKPVGLTTRYMYPRVILNDFNKYVTIQKYNGITPINYLYEAQSGEKRALSNDKYLIDNPLYDPMGNRGGTLDENGQTSDINSPNNVDLRYMFKQSEEGDADYNQLGLNASGGLDGNVVLITAQYDIFNLGVLTRGANAGPLLGFKNTPYLDSTIGTITNLLSVYRSNSLPDMVSKSSMFVRLDNFNSQSYNGQNRQPSKILYHIPRFDSGSNEFGGLFFEPNERTYLKLNNPTKLVINDFDISIVNADERLADSLTGKTIVMLHFRKSR